MSGSFNHTLMYHKWFGIPPEELPTNAYRMLAIPLYESDADVIENAVQQRLNFVAQFFNSEHSEAARTIHHELQQIERCLLNPQAKAAYDQQVKQAELAKLTRVSANKVVPTARPAAAAPASPAPAGSAASKPPAMIPVARPPRRRAPSQQPAKPKNVGMEILKIVVGGVAGVAIGLLVLVLVKGAKDDRHEAKEEKVDQPTFSEVAENPRPRAEVEPLPSDSTAFRPQASSPVNGGDSGNGNTIASVAEQNPTIEQAKPVVEQNPFETVGSSITKDASGTSANVNSPVQPKPAKPADPFEQLPGEVSLPSLLIRQPRELLTLGDIPTAGVKLELVTSAADLPENQDFQLAPDPQSSTAKWDLLIVNQGEQASPALAVATMSLVDESLTFNWLDEAVGTAALQLRNCLLRLTIGQRTHALCLRETETSDPVTLDLAERVIKRSVVIDPMPRADQIQFEVTALENFPDQAQFKNEQRSVDISREVVLELTQTGGAYFRIKAVRGGDAELSLLIFPMYKINAAEQFDLTTNRLESMKSGTASSLASAQRDLTAKVAELKALESQYNAVSRASTNNAGQALVKKQQLDAIASKAKVLNRSIKSLQRRIPEMQARLAAIPQLEQLVSQLHNKAQLRLRIYVSVDGQDMTLYTAG